MENFFSTLQNKNIELPENIIRILNNCKGYSVFSTTEDLAVAALGNKDNTTYEVVYDVPGKGKITEAIIHLSLIHI